MDSFWQGHLQASSDEGAESSCQGSQPLNTFEWSALPPLVRFSAPLIRAHEAGSEFDDSPVASVWVHDIFVSKEPIFDQMRRDWAEYDKWHAARRAALMAAKCQATVAEVGAATVSSAASGSSSVSIPSGASRSGFGASASGGGGGGSSSSGISPWRFRPLALSSVRWTPPSLPSKSSLASLVNGGSEGGGGGAGGRGGSTSGGSVAVSAHEGGGSREVAGELACLRSNWFSLPQHASAHHGALLFPTGELASLRSNWSSLPQHASAHHGAPLFPAASNSNTPAQDGAVGVATRGAAAAAACAGSQSAPENSASNNYTEGDSLLQRFSDLFSFHSDPPRTTEDMGGALVASQQAAQQAAQLAAQLAEQEVDVVVAGIITAATTSAVRTHQGGEKAAMACRAVSTADTAQSAPGGGPDDADLALQQAQGTSAGAEGTSAGGASCEAISRWISRGHLALPAGVQPALTA